MTNWTPDFYRDGYEGYERLDKFSDHGALARYRDLLLQKTDEQVEFIARHLGRRKLRVIELCSGNGRLLVALAKRGMLESGLGVEISRSRAAFAKRWVDDEGLSAVRVVEADALQFDDFVRGEYDLAVCLTGAFGYFKAIGTNAPNAVVALMRRGLREDGFALFELYQISEKRRAMLALNGNGLRLWQPLPEADRFAYYLDDYQYWPEERLLRHEKIFIGRDGTVDAGRYEMLGYYDVPELRRLLESNGLSMSASFSTFSDTEYREGASEALITLAAVR